MAQELEDLPLALELGGELDGRDSLLGLRNLVLHFDFKILVPTKFYRILIWRFFHSALGNGIDTFKIFNALF